MAIYLATTKSISRSDGRSAVASAAYRAGEKLQDARYGKVQNYSRRHGVMSTGIILPNALKGKVTIDRNSLWNMAEQAEKRKDSRVAREWLLNLPHELDESIRQEMAHHFAQTLADRYGVIADCCIHRPSEEEIERGADPRNFHAHIMLTTRQAQLSADGQITLGDKATVELSDTKRRSLGLDRVGAEITELRLLWEQIANEKLAEYGFELIDSRSYQSQGIDQLPQLKMGKNATRMEREGIKTPVGDINRLIKERNELVFSRELAHIAHTNNQAEHIIIESRQSKQKSPSAQKRTQNTIQPLQGNLATYVPPTQEKPPQREISPTSVDASTVNSMSSNKLEQIDRRQTELMSRYAMWKQQRSQSDGTHTQVSAEQTIEPSTPSVTPMRFNERREAWKAEQVRKKQQQEQEAQRLAEQARLAAIAEQQRQAQIIRQQQLAEEAARIAEAQRLAQIAEQERQALEQQKLAQQELERQRERERSNYRGFSP